MATRMEDCRPKDPELIPFKNFPSTMPRLMLMLAMARLACIVGTVISADTPGHSITRNTNHLDDLKIINNILESIGIDLKTQQHSRSIHANDINDEGDPFERDMNARSIEKRFTRSWIDMIGHKVRPRKGITKSIVSNDGMPMLQMSGFMGKRTQMQPTIENKQNEVNPLDSSMYSDDFMDSESEERLYKKQNDNNWGLPVEFPNQMKRVEGSIDTINTEPPMGNDEHLKRILLKDLLSSAFQQHELKRNSIMPILHYLPAIQSRFQKQKQFTPPILHMGGMIGKRNRHIDINNTESEPNFKLLVKAVLSALSSEGYQT
ncbi:unnamed protein product [Owenia fusiformis]|uniref:Uncharacterized protein n=1 Tax=Owenia fusiformis TaxID=6347 RepID=A0A8J1TZW5_OWEFU|nr:unnamed protein product [Owenia fusiformis]